MNPAPSRLQQLRQVCTTRLAGEAVRAVELVLQFHLDEGLDVGAEADRVLKQAVLLLAGKRLGEESVILMQSSRMRLPKGIEDQAEEKITRFLEGREDPHARPGEDEEDPLIRPVRPGE